MLDPRRRVERVSGDLEPRNGVQLFCVESRVLPALVGRHRFGRAVAVEVCKEDADIRPTVQRHWKDESIPRRCPCVFSRVLKIDKVRQFAGCDDVRVAVAVDVGDIGVLGCCRVRSFRESRECPTVRIFRAERQPDVPVSDVVVLTAVAFSPGRVGLMHRDDVHNPIEVEVTAGQAVAPIDGDAADGDIIDDVLPPGNIGAIRGLGDREGFADSGCFQVPGIEVCNRHFLATG